MSKTKIAIICPGRGSYNTEELSYLEKYRPKLNYFFDRIDVERQKISEITVTELDRKDKYIRSLHSKGEHASALIYTCAMADFLSIDRNRYEITVVLGNSMGWYISLAAAGAMSNDLTAFNLVQTMGSMMKAGNIGGQVIYPLVDENWHRDPEKISHVNQILETAQNDKMEIYPSIYLGGSIVLGADNASISPLLKKLKPCKLNNIDYPFQLQNHAAFHTPILSEVSKKAMAQIPITDFKKPDYPMIDGRGKIWSPYSTRIEDLWHYTLGHQVTDVYDFSKSIEVAVKEFNPDKLVLLGPGSNLGGAIAQELIKFKWRGIDSKTAFLPRQKEDPFILAMGREEQRNLLVT